LGNKTIIDIHYPDSYTMISAYSNIPIRRYMIVVVRILISYVQIHDRLSGYTINSTYINRKIDLYSIKIIFNRLFKTKIFTAIIKY